MQVVLSRILFNMSDPHDDAELNRSPLGSQIASALRRDVVTGVVEAGTVLTQESVCQRFDVSRIPVRDALAKLETQGFVRPNKRAQMVVKPFTKSDLLDTFYVEALVSGATAARAAQNRTEAELVRLAAVTEAGEKAAAARDRSATARSSWEFHQIVNTMARSPRLIVALKAISIEFLQDFSKELPFWWDETVVEHREIYAAIESQDSATATRLTQSHFVHGGHVLSSYLYGDGGAPTTPS